jgi:hypothetical protein
MDRWLDFFIKVAGKKAAAKAGLVFWSVVSRSRQDCWRRALGWKILLGGVLFLLLLYSGD